MKNTHNFFEEYINSVSKKFSHKESSEMTYRADFEILLKKIFESINVKRIDHDAKSVMGNRPDFIVLKNDIPILYIEAKDIGVSLDKVEKSEQMARYFGYANLVLTDYVEFRFYRNGKRYDETIKIAEVNSAKRLLKPANGNYERVSKTLLDITQTHKEPIKSGEHLAKIMGGKAQRIRDNILSFLSVNSIKNKDILNLFNTFKKLLIHDLTLESFADMYAQTLVYGLFVARYHDKTSDDFTRQEARELIPRSNPLLRHFFDHIVGPDFDKRLEYIVNELCEVFSHADVQLLMKQYYEKDLWGNESESPDPVIHFYEDFLKEYDPVLRKKLGAFYTPLPVVRFIVRSVDYLLEKEFNLSSGLADTSKLPDGKHKVQILDPAAGTGTFISAVIRQIYKRFKDNNQLGRWTNYVHHDLLPRLHGFELMMAPYTIAHLKLSMAFKETGFKYFNNRLSIYLTNSLEESSEENSMFTGFGFAESIAEESRQASKIKNESQIMVVIGNPPYSVSSSNKGKWIQNLMKVYKENLNEKNIQPLSDDYIKFIRFAEHFIEKNKCGIVAMITNNSFLDGIIHRQMRKHLLETFDDIYILDLHGNSKKKEKAPDGGKDENVFDIQQGVAISIFIRKSIDKKNIGQVFKSDLYGNRECKFKTLNNNNLISIKFEEIKNIKPNYFFFSKISNSVKVDGLLLTDIFKNNSISVVFGNKEKYLNFNFTNNLTDSILVCAFDQRFTKYGNNLQRPRKEIMDQIFCRENIALLSAKQNKNSLAFVSNIIISKHSLTDSTYTFPLYVYLNENLKIANLKTEFVNEIESKVGKSSPEEKFDYIYAILHSPHYREKYKEFLKIDFPRIPYPKDKKSFGKLVSLGTELRQLHLLESPEVNKFITTYSIAGSDEVERVTYKDGKVYINKDQYFGNVKESVWNFYIGGYQPSQKWLKDRKGRKLTNEDIEHYQKMIVAMSETERIMGEIDKVLEL